jgi:organic radical activating enzyme
MINTQKREAVLKDKKVLEVCDVWRTIQGEGPFAGLPAVFVRLAGCNLNCPACDTDYTSNRMSIRPEQLVERIQYKQTGGLVVFTGGEPLRQNIGIATKLLYRLGYTVQIETNGMLYRDDMEYNGLTIVCSPKSPIIHEKLQPLIRAVKYVVQAGFVDVDGLPTRTLGNH